MMTTTTAPTLRHALDVLESTAHEVERNAERLFEQWQEDVVGVDFGDVERAQGRVDGLRMAADLVRRMVEGR